MDVPTGQGDASRERGRSVVVRATYSRAAECESKGARCLCSASDSNRVDDVEPSRADALDTLAMVGADSSSLMVPVLDIPPTLIVYVSPS